MRNNNKKNMGEGSAWKGRGVRLGAVESDAERELYERTREATEEAQRQGAAQLKAAVKAAGAVKPLSDSFSRWSLVFKDSRVEEAYRLKSICNSDKIDSFPVACELAACTLHLFRLKMITDSPSFPVHFLGHICLAVCCITVLSTQLLFSKWYQGCRGIIMQYLTSMLWIWESIQIFLMADAEWTYFWFHALPLSTCMSLLYQVPFCVHLRLRIFGLACQAAAVMARGRHQNALALLFAITACHLLGVLLAYILDWRARLCFLKSMPFWLLDDMTETPLGHRLSDPCRDSLFRQFWSMFYSRPLEKSSSNLSAVTITPVDCSAPRRALGGFAGGFAGVSGLKCKVPVSTSLFSSSESSSEQERMLDSESGNDTIVSKNIAEMRLRHKHDKVEERWMQETTTYSACSQIEGTFSSSHKHLL